MSGEKSAPKRLKLTSHQTDSQSLVTAEIFRLNTDCFEEIFEYLDSDDLNSLGLTCKKLQRLTGIFFKQNICSTSFFGEYNDFFPGFGQFIKLAVVETQIKQYNFDPLRFIASDIENSSLDHIMFRNMDLSFNIESIRNILEKVNIIEFDDCKGRFPLEFYDNFLKYCQNLTHLHICGTDVGIHRLYYEWHEAVFGVSAYRKDYVTHTLNSGEIVEWDSQWDKHVWLDKNYPKLVHLELYPDHSSYIQEVRAFLERHPNIKTFGCTSGCLSHFQLLERSSINLDVLKILVTTRRILRYLPILHEQGFYKRLHIDIHKTNQYYCDKFITLPGLEQLTIRKFRGCYSLPSLENLKELIINDGAVDVDDIEILAKSLQELERIQLWSATPESIVPFIRHSKQLTRFKVAFPNYYGSLKILTLNNERKKLFGAKKLYIYVQDEIFLATKWEINNGNIDLNLISMKNFNLYSVGLKTMNFNLCDRAY